MAEDEYNLEQLRVGKVPPAVISELTRAYQAANDLVVDGHLGPATRQHAIHARLARNGSTVITSATEYTDTVDRWPDFAGPLERLPRNRSEVYAIFGDPGTDKPNRKWERANIVTVRDLPGVPSKWHVQLHRLAEPYIREGLRRARLACPDYKIARVGGYVHRHIRHDPARPLSMHSWGIAIDIDAPTNSGKEYPIGAAPEPWSAAWAQQWPRGLPRSFVAALCSVGMRSGIDWDGDGRSDDQKFVDPMHFEIGSPLP